MIDGNVYKYIVKGDLIWNKKNIDYKDFYRYEFLIEITIVQVGRMMSNIKYSYNQTDEKTYLDIHAVLTSSFVYNEILMRYQKSEKNSFPWVVLLECDYFTHYPTFCTGVLK